MSLWSKFIKHSKVKHIKITGGKRATIKQLVKWQEYTEELYKKDHDPHNHDGVITHLEPDILECEVKWALGSITTNNRLVPNRKRSTSRLYIVTLLI